ncbi:MAG: SpoVA/SpoVAEb family sporulation membrane protein [Oscillospiraceae bacterium]|nr:SpoVA/SpoVAEb family sporulation membrane protein [Oscillospiraceae bacterium]
MKMTKQEYSKYVDRKSPPSPIGGNMIKAFIVGGVICCFGQVINSGFLRLGWDELNSAAGTSVMLIFLGVVLTAAHIYNKIATFAGAGTLVPITGFANAVAAPALEFKSEGVVTGLSAKMFVIAGPVLVFGVAASVIYGIIYRIMV